MSDTLKRIVERVAVGDVRISEHGYHELASDGLTVRDLVQTVDEAELVEDYPGFPKGPCVLVLQADRNQEPVHVVWGIPKGEPGPAVLITAYRPDPDRWSTDLLRRKK